MKIQYVFPLLACLIVTSQSRADYDELDAFYTAEETIFHEGIAERLAQNPVDYEDLQTWLWDGSIRLTAIDECRSLSLGQFPYLAVLDLLDVESELLDGYHDVLSQLNAELSALLAANAPQKEIDAKLFEISNQHIVIRDQDIRVTAISQCLPLAA